MSSRPNVVVFLTDQQRWDCSSLHGNPLDLMPTFDRLARSGTHVANSFTCQPVCAPARSTIQLGCYPTATGVWKNGLSPDFTLPSLAGEFARAGYATCYVGKWHLYDHGTGDPGPVPAVARLGYEQWLASNILEFTSDAYQTRLYDEANRAVDIPGYRVDACVDAAIGRLVELSRGDRPFFLFLSLLEPHHQNSRDDYPAPHGYRERYEGRWMPPDLAALDGPGNRANAHAHIAGYYGMVRRIDEALARLHDTMYSLGLLDQTVMLFTSDHGCHFKTRNSEYKRSLHEASIRVPTMLTGGPFRGGGTIHELVSHVDLPPTLLDACGIPIPDTFHGRSIVPLTHGKTSPAIDWPQSVYIQVSEAEIGRAIRTHRWKYGVRAVDSFESPIAFARPTAETMVETFLYDLYADPHELNNLVAYDSHQALRESLRDRLREHARQAGETPPEIEPHPEPVTGGQLLVDPSEWGART